MASTINADNGAVSGSAGLKSSADSTGVLALQTNGTTAVSVSTGQVVTLTQPLPVASGGTGATTLTANNVLLGNGTSAPQFVAPGTTGNVLTSNGTTWTSVAAPSGMVYPGSGIANSTGSAWGTSYSTTGTGTVVALATSPSFTTPILGTPASGNLANCTFPTLNQNTTGSSASCTGNAATVTNGLYTTGGQTIAARNVQQGSQTGSIATASGSLGGLEMQSANASGAAFMTFHRPGAFAGYFGLDTDNVLKVGGWSFGAVAYPISYPTSTYAPGTAPTYSPRAWVNFNGSGTVAIRASGNVSSITDNGTGNYTVNFSTALSDADYSKTVNTGRDNGGVNGAWTVACTDMSGTSTTVNPTTSGFRFFVLHPPNQVAQDPTYCNVAVFR